MISTPRIRVFLAATLFGLASGLPLPAAEPYRNAIALDVPEELGNRTLAEWGFVDVTAAPFHADPTGATDATAALQRAIVFAREHQMVMLFTNLVDSPRFPGDGSPEHFAGEGVDPHRWHMLIERSAAETEVATAPLERPVLYRRGRPRAAEED